MQQNHYQGRITYGHFDERVYLESLEFSLQKTIMDDFFKGREVVIELWLSKDERDYTSLKEHTDITPQNRNWLQLYTWFRAKVDKESLLSLFGQKEFINQNVGFYLYVVVTAQE